MPQGVLDTSKMNIEHIAPQSEGSLPQHRIAEMGNLVLVNHLSNSDSLGSKPYSKKKPLLSKAMGYVDPFIEKQSEWGSTEIESRTASMAEFAYKSIWTW